MYKNGPVLLLFSFLVWNAKAADTLRLTREQCEAVFLRQNVPLIAGKLKIEEAKAMVKQAALWPNPAFTMDQVNLWATPRQTGGQEVVPPLWNTYGRNQQFAFEIEQLIQTAGKRKKLMAIEQVGVDKAEQYFEDLLRHLKLEFRRLLTDLQYAQLNSDILQEQLISLEKLIAVYEKQLREGNIPSRDVARLRAQQMTIERGQAEWLFRINDAQKELKTLMHLPAESHLIVAPEDYGRWDYPIEQLALEDLLNQAKDDHPDVRLALLEEQYYRRLYAYERASRVPDVSFKGSYDRNGNAMLDFVGFGITVDLPVFNRNQGRLKAVSTMQERTRMETEYVIRSMENDITGAYRNLLTAYGLLKKTDPEYARTLEKLLISYTQNFQLRNISLLEYVDFLETYLDNRKGMLDAVKAFRNALEELSYTLGKDIAQ